MSAVRVRSWQLIAQSAADRWVRRNRSHLLGTGLLSLGIKRGVALPGMPKGAVCDCLTRRWGWGVRRGVHLCLFEGSKCTVLFGTEIGVGEQLCF